MIAVIPFHSQCLWFRKKGSDHSAFGWIRTVFPIYGLVFIVKPFNTCNYFALNGRKSHKKAHFSKPAANER